MPPVAVKMLREGEPIPPKAKRPKEDLGFESAVCQGCGTCVAECPAHAIQLMDYTDAQMTAMVDALLSETSSFIPLEEVRLR